MKAEKYSVYEGEVLVIEGVTIQENVVGTEDRSYRIDKNVENESPSVVVMQGEAVMIEYRSEEKDFYVEAVKGNSNYSILAKNLTGKQLAIALIHTLQIEKAYAWDANIQEELQTQKPSARRKGNRKK